MREFAALVGDDDPATIGERVTILEEHRAEVQERIRELRRNLSRVEAKIAWYGQHLPK